MWQKKLKLKVVKETEESLFTNVFHDLKISEYVNKSLKMSLWGSFSLANQSCDFTLHILPQWHCWQLAPAMKVFYLGAQSRDFFRGNLAKCNLSNWQSKSAKIHKILAKHKQQNTGCSIVHLFSIIANIHFQYLQLIN